MQGLMMDTPLLVSDLIRHADRHYHDAEIVSRRVEGDLHRYTYRDAHKRSRQLAKALRRFGLKPGDRVATLAWNTHRHLEVYYAVARSGMGMDTLNPPLLPQQIPWVLNDPQDTGPFIHTTFLPLLPKIA